VITDLTGSTTAVVAASSSPSCNGLTNGLPCGYSVSQVRSASGCPGGMSGCVVLHLFNGGTDLGTCTLVSVGAPTSASYSQVSQNTTTTPEPQTAKSSRSFGQVTFGCIPSGVATPPTGWNVLPTGFTAVGTTNTGFLVAVKNGYTQALQAQAGVASPATSATVSGTEWYYSPGIGSVAGGTLVALVPNTSASLLSIGTLSANVKDVNPSWSAGGTLSANVKDVNPSWSAGGASSAWLGSTAATWSAGGTTSGNINKTAGSFNVAETSAPPTGTPFTIQVDSEQMTVNTRTLVSGSTYTYAVTRAVNGTTAAAHSSGTAFNYQIPACATPCNFNVTETTGPPSSTPFVIRVDSEQMQVTARTLVSGSTYTYTVTRAYNSTTAAAHSAGATFYYQIPGCPTPCSFDVDETTTPSPTTNFVIQVDGEQMLVTARAKYPSGSPPSGCINSGQLWCYTATRAYNSTTASAHSAGATVSLVTGGCPTSCTFQVTETTAPPSVPFTIQVDSEQMQVTARTLVSGSTYNYTTTRAYNGTTAAVHTAGTTVYFLSVPYGYATQNDSSPSGTAMPVTSVNYTTGGCTYRESVSGSLTSPTGSVANTSASGIVTNSAGTLTPPLNGDFKFNVTCGSTVIADLDIAFNLGTMKATATYGAPAR